MENPYGFVITSAGWNLFARLIAGGAELRLTGMAVGTGELRNAAEAINLTDLISPVADGTTSSATITPEFDINGNFLQETISFVCEYRSNGESSAITGVRATDVTAQFNIREFGVYALDPDTNTSVMIYYGTLGDCPQPVIPYSDNAIDIRRFPVSIVISSELEVTLAYPPIAFVTYEEMLAFAENPCRPSFLADAAELIAAHNVSNEAHANLRNLIAGNSSRIKIVEDFINGEASVSFAENFDNLDNVKISVGAWNTESARIEF